MKTIKHLLITIAMLLCSATANAHDFEVDGIYYNIISANDLTVAVTYKGNSYDEISNEYSGEVIIPETIAYKSRVLKVISIGRLAFDGCSGITSIEIPNSVTTIEDYAFRGCTSLTSVDIPNSVTSIEWYAFYGCTGLTSVEIGNSVTSIGMFAFGGCTSLTSIIIGNSVTTIEIYAFEGCTSLTSIIIGNSVTTIEIYAFEGCTNLTSIHLLGETPPTVGSKNFTESQYIDIVVNIPLGTLETYQTTDTWKNFWDIQEYSVHNKVRYSIDGEEYASYTVKFGDAVPVPEVFAKEGYTFSWMNEIPKTMPAKDIVIHGSYVADTAIEEIYLEFENIKVYNLRGLRITETDKLTRGVYIINGKKTFVK